MSESKELTLHSGYVMTTDDERKRLVLAAPDGKLCLAIVLTPEGPRIEVEAASLGITTRGDVSVDCESFHLRAEKDIQLKSEIGEVNLVANDDVVLEGERIQLNRSIVHRE